MLVVICVRRTLNRFQCYDLRRSDYQDSSNALVPSSYFCNRKSVNEVTLYTSPLVEANVASFLEFRRQRQALIQSELELEEEEAEASFTRQV